MNLDLDQNLCKSEPNHAKSHISWITLHTLKKMSRFRDFMSWFVSRFVQRSTVDLLFTHSPTIPSDSRNSDQIIIWLIEHLLKKPPCINRFTHVKNDLMPPSCGLSLRRTSMNWSEWTWHQVTPQHISRNTYAITCIPLYVHMYMYMYMYIMYMYTYTYMYTCMYM